MNGLVGAIDYILDEDYKRSELGYLIHCHPPGFKRNEAIRAYYAEAIKEIRKKPANVWALDAYEAQMDRLMTTIEFNSWCDIRQSGVVMYPQFPVGRFFVDFGNPIAKVAIECDGAAFHKDKERDAERQEQIEAKGWTVYRITGKQCMEDWSEIDDEETGAPKMVPGYPRRLLRHIAERYGLRPPQFKPIEGGA